MKDIFGKFLKDICNYCDEEDISVQPFLLWIYQIYTSQFSVLEAINNLKSFTNFYSYVESENVVKEVQKYGRIKWAYRKWVARQLPYTSTSHFELLVFGKRLDKRSEWSKRGNKVHASAFIQVRRILNWLTVEQARIEYRRIIEEDGVDVADTVMFGIYGFNKQFEFQGVDSWFEFEVEEEKGEEVEIRIKTSTRRSRLLQSKHNAKRFANWIRNSHSEKQRLLIWKKYIKSRAIFKQLIVSELGQEYITRWSKEFLPSEYY